MMTEPTETSRESRLGYSSESELVQLHFVDYTFSVLMGKYLELDLLRQKEVYV